MLKSGRIAYARAKLSGWPNEPNDWVAGSWYEQPEWMICSGWGDWYNMDTYQRLETFFTTQATYPSTGNMSIYLRKGDSAWVDLWQ